MLAAATIWSQAIEPNLHTELWTSWASMLRSYAAAHGLNSTQHAVVEVSAEEIILRVGTQWLRFTPSAMHASDNTTKGFHLNENGTVNLGAEAEEEMDMAAEHLTRDMMSAAH